MKKTVCVDCWSEEIKRGCHRCSSCRARHMRANDYDAEGWEVDVTTELPIKDGEIDYDGATHHKIDCTSRAQAEQFARQWLPRDKWGAVAITPYHMEDLAETRPCPIHKVYTADSTYIEPLS